MQTNDATVQPIACGLWFGVAVVAVAGLGVWFTDNLGQTMVKREQAPAVHDPLAAFLRRGEYTTDGTAAAQSCGDCTRVINAG